MQLVGQRPLASSRYVTYLLVEPHYEPAAWAWKLLNRLPFGLKNRLALGLSGRPFYPGETDYHFQPLDAMPGACSHVLVAVAT